MTLALTRAGTVGPIADAVAAAGGSVERLLAVADLPARTLAAPDGLILLRDQFRLVESAARMIGDDTLPARLSVGAGLAGLGPYGRHVLSFPDLGAAISLAYLDYGRLLQAATRMDLSVTGGAAVWSYAVTAPLTVGRQKNELLAIGYMLAIVRSFAGPEWTPERVELPGRLAGRQSLEAIFGATIREGPLAALVFPAALLDCPRRGSAAAAAPPPPIPADADVAAVTKLMIGLERDVGRFGLAATAARMGLTARTLQRRLGRLRTSFAALRAEADRDAAAELLRHGLSVTDTAACLGYADLAHFSRAFRRWTGVPPSRWADAPPRP